MVSIPLITEESRANRGLLMTPEETTLNNSHDMESGLMIWKNGLMMWRLMMWRLMMWTQHSFDISPSTLLSCLDVLRKYRLTRKKAMKMKGIAMKKKG